MKPNPALQIAELEEKLTRQNQAIAGYRDQLLKLTDNKSERDLYRELASVFACVTNTDDIYRQTLEALSQHLRARYYGVFLLDAKNEFFVYQHGKGYACERMPPIPYTGSLMGDCLFKQNSLWEPRANVNTSMIELEQDPAEYNVMCAPIILLGTDVGVIRIANIDPDMGDKALPILTAVTQLLCSTLERLRLQSKNELTLKSLDVSFSIARLLENTLNTQDILKRVCCEIPNLYPCAGCIIVMREPDGSMKPAFSYPDNFVLAGNPTSAAIYLRNLFAAFPSGSCCIQNIHREDRAWSWPGAKVKSLCMAAIHSNNTVEGAIITISPADTTYELSHVNLLGIVASQTAMTLERASYFQKQEDLARCDGLTGLFNHRIFQETVREEINRSQRYMHPISLIMLDIDHFKKCNDTYGHPVGDEVIKMVARTIKSMTRTTDRAFRYGGEEFTVILPETVRDNGVLLAERIRKKIEEDRSVKNIPVTISLGVVELQKQEAAESFVKRADTALYEAKKGGRNQVMAG